MMEETSTNKKNWHDKHYKLLLLIPILIVVFSLVYLVITYNHTGDFMKKDITLTGGTSITIYEENVTSQMVLKDLSQSLPDLDARSIYDFGTNNQKAITIDTTANWSDAQTILEKYLGYNLVQGQNVDVQFTGSSLSQSFYGQLLIAILIAFAFMAVVVFLIFKNFIPSTAVILSAFADILMTLVTVDLLGMKVSTAGIVAFLMLIGYSVDTDILLTTRVLRRDEGTVNERIFGAFKTGITMTLTSLFAVGVALIVVQSFSVVLAQIFEILVIGLFFDMLNTWITNVSLLKFYVEHRDKKREAKQ